VKLVSYADLHTHTTASDGTGAPAENVRLAAEAGMAALGITDHDTVGGVSEALEAGRKYGVRVVPGVEISTVQQGQDIHVLGYWINHEDPQLLARLAELRGVRDRRNEMILERLAQLGLPVTMEEVLATLQTRKRAEDTIGRPHIADAMVSKGYVSSIAEAFERYLGKGGAAYANPPRIEPATAVEWILAAGGAPVLAHPGLYDMDEVIPQLAAVGLVGLEVYHSDHTPEQEAHYHRLAQQYELIMTAGSDYHGSRNGVIFHAPIGARRIAVDVIDQLYERRGAQA
jgi:3',5'-nucleoside bisphosphate phosphatase